MDRMKEVERRKNLTKIAQENKAQAYFKHNHKGAHDLHVRGEAKQETRFITKLPDYPYDHQPLIR